MGTSTSQRSPRTPEWERVRHLYDDPGAPPEVIVARIVDALSPTTRTSMADSAVTRCMATLTAAGAGLLSDSELSLDPSLPAAVDLAAALRASASRDIAQARVASRFGEIGLDALSTATLDLATSAEDSPRIVRATLARYAEERRLAELAKIFVSHDVAYAFKHFVQRDTPAHVGGPRLRTVADADRLADEIAGLCRRTTSGLDLGGLEDDLWRATAEGDVRGHRLYQRALAAALGDSFGTLGGIA